MKKNQSNIIMKIATTASILATSTVALSFNEVQAQESLLSDLPVINNISDANEIRKYVINNYEKLTPQTISILEGISGAGDNQIQVDYKLEVEEVHHSVSPMLQSDN